MTDALPVIEMRRHGRGVITGHHRGLGRTDDMETRPRNLSTSVMRERFPDMGFDFHLIANFAALAMIALAGPAVIFILFYRRGAL